MPICLQVSTIGGAPNKLSGAFYRVTPKSMKLGEPYKKVIGSPTKVVTEVIHELDVTRASVESFHFGLDLPPEVSSILNRAKMAYLRANLGEQRGLLKLSCRKNGKDDVVKVLHYNSVTKKEADQNPRRFSGLPLKVVEKIFTALDRELRHPVVLELEGKVPKKVIDLFTAIVSLYNKQLS